MDLDEPSLPVQSLPVHEWTVDEKQRWVCASDNQATEIDLVPAGDTLRVKRREKGSRDSIEHRN